MLNFSDNKAAERQQIRTTLQPYLKPEHRFSVGGFIVAPNRAGCFWRNGKWFVYTTDEHAYCSISGPFSVEGVIYASLSALHLSPRKSGFTLSEEERDILLNNHFRSFAEIDAYMQK